MADIFIRRLFGKRGPYTEEEIRTWIREGKLSARTRAWRKGMAEWKPLSAWGFLDPSATPRRRFQAGRRRNYEALVAEEPGYGRLKYFVMSIVLTLLIMGGFLALVFYESQLVQALPLLAKTSDSERSFRVLAALLFVILFVGSRVWLAKRRLENIGWHGGWSLGVLVPGLNSLLTLCFIAVPPGYASTKKLDGVAWVWLLIFALNICAVVLGLVNGFGQMVIAKAKAIQAMQPDLSQFRPSSSSADGASNTARAQSNAPAIPPHDLARLRDLMTSLTNEVTTLQKDYDAEIEQTGLRTVMNPRRLVHDTSFLDSRAILAKAREVIVNYRTKADAMLQGFPIKVEAYGMRSGIENSFLKGFEKALSTAVPLIRQTWEIDAKTLDRFGEALDLLESTKGFWVVENGLLSFDRPEDLKKYNAIMEQVAEAGKQQQELRKRAFQEASDALQAESPIFKFFK